MTSQYKMAHSICGILICCIVSIEIEKGTEFFNKMEEKRLSRYQCILVRQKRYTRGFVKWQSPSELNIKDGLCVKEPQ